MRIPGRNAIIYGGSGAIGSAMAVALAMGGLNVHLVGRTGKRMEVVVKTINSLGYRVTSSLMDVNAQNCVERHAEDVASRHGGIDVVVNALGFERGTPTALADLSVADFFRPIDAYLGAYLGIAKSASAHMKNGGGGVIISVFSAQGRQSAKDLLGYSVACSGMESLTRSLAAELGTDDIRVVGIRSETVPESVDIGSHTRTVHEHLLSTDGSSSEQAIERANRSRTLLNRLPTVADLAQAGAFLASAGAGAMTGTILNLTCGSVSDT